MKHANFYFRESMFENAATNTNPPPIQVAADGICENINQAHIGANGASSVLISADWDAGIKRVPSTINIVAVAKATPNPTNKTKSIMSILKGELKNKLSDTLMAAEIRVDKIIGLLGNFLNKTTNADIPNAIKSARTSPTMLMDPCDPPTIITTPTSAIVAKVMTLRVTFSLRKNQARTATMKGTTAYIIDTLAILVYLKALIKQIVDAAPISADNQPGHPKLLNS